ncbi:MAG: hypothetical protein LBK75_06460 [Oscillospiraceae bacterium]|jgi:hypothetical protein|nr:hypothetical protein [Oscillospiraceae bacterium]
MNISILSPKLLSVTAPDAVYMGGSQEWYEGAWQRRAGCGPTVASGLVWYLVRSRPRLAPLCDVGDAGQVRFLALMRDMFDCVTPGSQGVNTARLFSDGVRRYGAARGVPLAVRTLEIHRRGPGALRDFAARCLRDDLPMGFLNLSNGALRNLDSWHWVLLSALETETLTAEICDQGHVKEIDMAMWMRTTLLGGALVALEAEA